MSKRRLADAAARTKAFLLDMLMSREGFKHMDEQYKTEHSGYSAPNYELWVAGTISMFNNMKTVAATRDAVQLLDHAARSLPNDMDVFDMRPEVPAGFLFLGKPLMSGAHEVIAYTWISMIGPVGDNSNTTAPLRVDSSLIVGTVDTAGRYGVSNFRIATGRTFENIAGAMTEVRNQAARDDAMTDLRVVIAFNLLLAQEVVDTEEATPTRQLRRQASRHNAPLDPVVIVQLPIRHHTHSNGNGAVPVDWSHRWIVSGHWRKQWYATTETHRPKWIAPHIKGPDDKPLVVKEKLYVFDPKPFEE